MLVKNIANWSALVNAINEYAAALSNRDSESLSYNELGWLRCISSSAAMASHKSGRTKAEVLSQAAVVKTKQVITKEQIKAVLTREEIEQIYREVSEQKEAVA